MRRHREHALHRAVADYLAAAIGEPGRANAHATMWLSIDHANARDALTGALRKARGVVAGVPDVMLWHRGATIGIELKGACGVASVAQKAFAAALTACGGHWHLARTLDDVAAVLRDHAVPVRASLLAVSAPQRADRRAGRKAA